MKKRIAGAALAAALLTGCAPTSSAPEATGADEKTGTLRVWLFDEPNRAPKEKVVQDAIKEFTAAHSGVTVDVQYIAVETRGERFKGAFNDPASAPDVVEFGNTDLAEYVDAGGLADLTADLTGWSEGADLGSGLRDSATVDGKTYALPWWVGVRALYYRTDVFAALGLKPPATMAELTTTARAIRKARPELFGVAVGGKYTFGALPFVWANGGDITSLDSAPSRAGVTAYTDLLKADNCPPQQCADLTGGKTVDLFAAGRAGMGIIGNFNHAAVDAGVAKGKYAVVPLPGTTAGSIAPAFAGGNNLGLMRNTKRHTLAADFLKLLGGRKYQLRMYDAMGNLPTLTSARTELAAKDPFLKPFLDTIASGTKFVPIDPGWGKIDSQAVIPTMLQSIVTGKSSVDAATGQAATAVKAALQK